LPARVVNLQFVAPVFALEKMIQVETEVHLQPAKLPVIEPF
jgi:hypothetical protein